MSQGTLDNRPIVPKELRNSRDESMFVPAWNVHAWVSMHILDRDGKIYNPDHAHLEFAAIGWLWTNQPYKSKQRQIVGRAEQASPPPGMFGWNRGRWDYQIREWFGPGLDFVITLYGPWCYESDDASFCSLVEHELYHCAQKQDEFGAPKFHKETGLPVFCIQGHDVEQFSGVVERYGVEASGVGGILEAANKGPTVARAKIAGACGTCRRAA